MKQQTRNNEQGTPNKKQEITNNEQKTTNKTLPAPITHIAFSIKLLENRLPCMNRRLFLQGTLFPDIRYLGLLEREDTHLPLENLSVLAKDEPFTAGLKFHNFLDHLRQQWLAREDVYAAIGPTPYKGLLTKFYEDYIFYQHVADWKPVKNSLSWVSSEERRFGIPDSMVMLWHYLLKLYFRTGSTHEIALKNRRLINNC